MVSYCEKKVKAVTQLVVGADVYYNMPFQEMEQSPSVKIAELMELNTFVQHYSQRTQQYKGQIEQLRERSNQLRAEAAQLLHRQPLHEWSTR
ncbi:hypothetical protein SK066_18830 [Paenibacillus hunanensis]|uniref:hypothetical protein n=1 Tax=Paenibacillus hunanensis TaxID=539262 RepID=UPI002A69FD53|nr:hypothetical protein [Paenibacillus hunanensis]WPP40629.1 hypothetical protein SK066_18830 [Paenibacillus hunanensis]